MKVDVFGSLPSLIQSLKNIKIAGAKIEIIYIRHLGGCPRKPLSVISTKGRNLKVFYFQYDKISLYARNDNFDQFSDSHLVADRFF